MLFNQMRDVFLISGTKKVEHLQSVLGMISEIKTRKMSELQ